MHCQFFTEITSAYTPGLGWGEALRICCFLEALLDSKGQERLSMMPKVNFMLEDVNDYLKDMGLVSCTIDLETYRGQKCYRDPALEPSSTDT